jgi:hypothetical protein
MTNYVSIQTQTKYIGTFIINKQIAQIEAQDKWLTQVTKLTSGNVKEIEGVVRHKTAKAESFWQY